MKKILLLIGLFILCLSSISPAAAADNAVLVRVGVYENAPKIFTDEQGKAAGFWPAIIEYIAAEEAWDIQYIHGTWAECLARLQNNEIDIMPDVAYSEDRATNFTFSQEPVYVSWSRVYVQAGSKIHNMPDLAGKSVAVLKGSINVEGPDGIKQLAAAFDLNCTFIETDSYLKVFELVDAKQADAGVVSKDFAYLHERDYKLAPTDIIFQPARLYFAFPPESSINPYLIERIDYQLKQLKAAGDSIYYRALDKWLGIKPDKQPVIPDIMIWTLAGIASLTLLLGGGVGIFRYQVRRKTKELAAEIVGHKQTEAVLQVSEEKYRVTLDSMMEGCQIIGFDWRYIYVNNTAVKHIRRTREELLGCTMTELFPGIVGTELFVHLQRCMKDRIPHRLEHLSTFKDGTQSWFELSIEPVREGIFMLSIDITERKTAEQALKGSEDELRHIFEAVPEGIIITDLDCDILDINQAIVDMLGFENKGKITGRKSWEFIAENDLEIARECIQNTMEKGVVRNLTHHMIKKDGSEFPVECSTAVLKDDSDKPVGIIFIIEDITARQQAQEEHQKVIEYRELDRLKTNLLSTISHELRTPLASIKGYASMLLLYDRKLEKKQKKESLEAIDRATDRLTELIDHLLDMSRLDAGLLKLTLQPVKIREIITAAIDEAGMRSPKYYFKAAIKGKIPEVMADARRLRQVIDNILENAVKYSPEETEITLRAEVKPEEILVSITDQGRGIPEAEYQKIFERMYRIEQRLQKDPGGLGLGLSLCKALVEAHAGRIWVESELNNGSTFYFTLPLKDKNTGNTNAEKEQATTHTRDR